MSKSTVQSASRSRYTLLLVLGFIAVVILTQQVYFAIRVRAFSPFTAGNVVVYRVGDGAAALGSTATAVFLDEYTPAGVLVQSIALPTTTSGLNRRLTATGNATTEGLMTRSVDGQYLILAGYDTTIGTTVPGSAATINRVVGRVDASGNINTTTALNDPSANVRGAASTNGTDLWISCSSNGSRYSTLGTVGGSTQLSTSVTNLRGTAIFNNQLYVSSASGAFQGVASVGSGTPTTSGQTITLLPGFPTATGPSSQAFAFFNSTTLYVADDRSIASGGGLQRWTLSAGTWTLSKTFTTGLTTGLRGMTVTTNGSGQAVVFATTGNTPSQLVKVTDTNSAGDAFTTIGTASTNTAFRGVALAPSSGPPNQAIVPNCPASLNTVQGTPTSAGVSATDPDGTVTSATITSAAVTGITLTGVTPAGAPGGALTATLSVANNTPAGTHNVTIQYSNNDAPTPQTASCTVVVTVTPPNQPIAPSCPGALNVNQGNAGSANVSASDPDGTVTSASITSAPVTGITLDSFAPAGAVGGTASATLNVANTTALGTYNVDIQWTNNDSPTPQTANCTVVVTVQPAPGRVVVSQVYGGGGNTGSTLKNDYIEILNHSSAPVDLSGWSVQHLPTSGSTWSVTPLTNFVLQPGQYYLIQESQGAGGTDDLPTPDAIGTITVSSTSGKVALVSNTTTLIASCPSGSGIVDFVGYGNTSGNTANCFEGSGPVPTLSNTTAALRKDDGCFDTDDNANDFLIGGTTPRNSSSPFNDCTGLVGFGSANPTSVLQGESTTLTVYVAPAQNPPSTGITVTADLSQIGGSSAQAFSGGPTTFTFVATIPANNPTGMKSLPVTIADGQARTANTNIVLSVLPLIPDHVTISQLYGGGGNSGAIYNHDFVELYNPHTSTFDLTGWSLQYSSATGDTWQVQPLGGAIAPGEYYLIGLATQNSAVGAPLPPANVNGDINMSGTTGKIALVNNFDALEGPCPLGNPGIVDFLGYGTTANCAETTRALAPSNTTSLFRQNGGARDTDNNLADFFTGTPTPRRTAPIVEIGPSVFGTDPRNGATTAPRDATISINFTEPVTVDSGWYDITCVTTGNHNSATVRSFFGGDTHTITPNVNFLAGEQCTVTIFKDAIHDVDTDDTGTNADTLPANKVFTFTVATGTAPPYPLSVHLTMGNPNAGAIVNDDNYLMDKPEFSLSYNRSRGTANWVSWHLADEWIGTLVRVDSFRADPEVPPDWFRVSGFDYVGSGFDRGHMVPNADRDKETSTPINQATFLMTNMIPQAPANNQGPWAALEAHLRTLLPANEVYIVAGGAGTGGDGSNGAANTIAGGNVFVPAQTWKVALILPKASGDDVARVSCSTQTLAVIMPNSQTISSAWQDYITTVDAVEALTSYDFFSTLPDAVENCVEAGTNGTNPPGTANQSATTLEDTPVEITLSAVRSNSNTLTFSIVSGPVNGGSLGSVSAATCGGGNCTATVTYTPGVDSSGPDSFTFRASDGSIHSNTSTVSITVLPDQDADGVTDANDNCPSTANTDQADTDFDGIGDVCDNCPSVVNAGQEDDDSDGVGNPCDPDDDNDGVLDTNDLCPGTPAGTQVNADGCADADGDGIADADDNCPSVANADQLDTDNDGLGNSCDGDDDNDGVLDGSDNCPFVANPGQANNDGDGAGDACDADDDNDGVLDGVDNCPFTANTDQANNDGDGLGDVCDPDDDNDGVLDGADNCPFVSNSSQSDFDGDGIGDACDASPYDNIQIVFSSTRHGNFEIYGMKADGTGVTRLTNNGASDLNPALSPDRTKIVFTSTRDGNFEIYSMNTNGTGVTRLTNNSAIDGFAAWSPTGAKIAFASTRNGNLEIYSMNSDGTGVTRLTNNSAIDTNPAWSPNGLKIAFTSTRHGNVEIYSMNPDGTGVTRLTNHGDQDAFPTWSPDSTKIAFASNRSGGINFEIYSMNANGSGVTRLTNHSAIDVEPAWGANGKIAFTSTRNFNVEIYSMNSNGTGVTRLTNNPFWVLDASPHW